MALTTLDRTNRDNAFYQVKAATRAAFDKTEEVLSTSPNSTYQAIVLFSEERITIEKGWEAPIPGAPVPFEMGASLGVIEKYKIYFRIPLLHAHLPLPPSFRNITIPFESYNQQVTGHLAHLAPQFARLPLANEDSNIVFSHTYIGDYCLEPEAEEALLIACHPSLWVSRDPSNPSSAPSHLDPGDTIEVKFSDGTFESAQFVKVVAKGLNLIVKNWSGDTASALNKFDGDTSILADLQPGPGFGAEEEIETKFPEQFNLKNMLKNSGNLANLPNDQQLRYLQKLVTRVLDPMQTKLNEQGRGEIYITSGFRNEEVNKNVGSKTKKHTTGTAADMRIPSGFGGAEDFSNWIIEEDIDWLGQLIWYDVDIGGHVHIEYIEDSSEKIYFHAYDSNGTTLYKHGYE